VLCSVVADVAVPEGSAAAAVAKGRQQPTKRRRSDKAVGQTPIETESSAGRRGAPNRRAGAALPSTSDKPASDENAAPNLAKRRSGAPRAKGKKGAAEASDSGAHQDSRQSSSKDSAAGDDGQLPGAELLKAVQKAVEDLFTFDNLAERSLFPVVGAMQIRGAIIDVCGSMRPLLLHSC
jgi:hypothetical protein